LNSANPPPITLARAGAKYDSIAPAWPETRSRTLSFTTSRPKLSCKWVITSPSHPCSNATYCGTRPISWAICTTISGYSSSANSSPAAIIARIIVIAANGRDMPSWVSRRVGGSST
jgi:hypothetical protein